jgi:hypothetical protein
VEKSSKKLLGPILTPHCAFVSRSLSILKNNILVILLLTVTHDLAYSAAYSFMQTFLFLKYIFVVVLQYAIEQMLICQMSICPKYLFKTY